MKIFNTLTEWQKERQFLDKNTLGCVPTMGNLHKGHASLFAQSLKENEYTIGSIFINPMQFNDKKDFISYPRTIEADIRLLENLGVDYCIMPSAKEIYADSYNYCIIEKNNANLLEGRYRPGHFDGVLTIVMKLLNIIKPSRAYFGEKDFQQYNLIKNMVDSFFLDVEIKLCPTIREESGLAYSSRNNLLNKEERSLADKFAQIFRNHKNSINEIKSNLSHLNIDLDYLEEINNRRFIAVKIGNVRLIDNYLVE